MSRLSSAQMLAARGDVQAALKELAPSADAANNAGFKRWVDDLKTELEALKDAGLVVGAEKTESNTAHSKLLALTGMSRPHNQEEQLRLYLAFRAVVCFVTRKLDQLQAESSAYEELKKEQVQANGNIGITRPVAR